MSLSRVYMCVIERGKGFLLSLDLFMYEWVVDREGGGEYECILELLAS